MRLKKKAVIFDLDGVICATDRLQFQAWQAVAGPLGITLDEAVTDRLRGVSTEACLDIVLEGRSFDREEREALMEKKRAAYRELLRTLGPADLRDEVRDTLWELRARGYRLALGSSSGEAGFILERIGLGWSAGPPSPGPSPIRRCFSPPPAGWAFCRRTAPWWRTPGRGFRRPGREA